MQGAPRAQTARTDTAAASTRSILFAAGDARSGSHSTSRTQIASIDRSIPVCTSNSVVTAPPACSVVTFSAVRLPLSWSRANTAAWSIKVWPVYLLPAVDGGNAKMAKCKIGSRATFATPTGSIRGVVRSAPYKRNGKNVVDVNPTAYMDLRFSSRWVRGAKQKDTVAVALRQLQCGARR
jgi:hypothetical protein